MNRREFIRRVSAAALAATPAMQAAAFCRDFGAPSAAKIVWDAVDVEWTAAATTGQVTHGVIYADTASANPLLMTIEFDCPMVVEQYDDFVIEWKSDGVVK